MWPGYWEPGVRQCPHVMVGRSPRPVFAVDCFLHPFNIIIIFFHINLIIIWWDTVCSTCAHNVMRALQEDVRGVSKMVKPVFLAAATLSTLDKKSLYCQQYSLDLSKQRRGVKDLKVSLSTSKLLQKSNFSPNTQSIYKVCKEGVRWFFYALPLTFDCFCHPSFQWQRICKVFIGLSECIFI